MAASILLHLSLIYTLLSLLNIALGQSDVGQCLPGWEWASNSRGQNPCAIAVQLAQQCNPGFSLPPLNFSDPTGYHYYNTPQDPYPCQCSMVVYSLISACGACQGSIHLQWSMWSLKCTSFPTAGTFPKDIPDTTTVPHWAFANASDGWNISGAKSLGNGPESTGTPSPTSTSSNSSTGSPSPDTGAAHGASHKAAIAGGIVAGIIGLVLFSFAIAYFIRQWLRLHEDGLPTTGVYEGRLCQRPRINIRLCNMDLSRILMDPLMTLLP